MADKNNSKATNVSEHLSTSNSIGRFEINSQSDLEKKYVVLEDDKDSRSKIYVSKEDDNVCSKLSFRDKPPIIDHYRNKSSVVNVNLRPSMLELIQGNDEDQDAIVELEKFKEKNVGIIDVERGRKKKKRDKKKSEDKDKQLKTVPPSTTAVQMTKFGWIQGVMVRCMLNILGVMLYLRISWVAGQAGIVFGWIIVLLSCAVTTMTTLSMCAICTNGEVKGGGAYFLISRSLGPEFGGSIGIIFSIANAVGVSMYIVGFGETVRDLMKSHGMSIIDNGMNDVRIIGLITCVILLCILFIGMEFESKMQLGLLFILLLSLISYVVGTFLPVSIYNSKHGITGYNIAVLGINLWPDWQNGENFFSVFAIFFPAATGIMAGANISGDLKDPQTAIPKGTLLAILITTLVYLAAIFMTGSTVVRYSTGLSVASFSQGIFEAPVCSVNNTCPYGLINYFQIMKMESLWGPLITAGIFAATLSSALASLVSGPKVFQAVCKDRLFPYINYFGKGYGNDKEPRRAYLLAFGIAVLMILIGDLNAIAPIISNFFLAAYTLINYACFDASFAESPGFRPGFKYYNMWVSLLASALCLTIMFIVSWWTALLTFAFFAILFVYIHKRNPDVNWGSSKQAHIYRNALSSMLKLNAAEQHVKNYRPQLLVLTGNPAARTALVDFAYNLTKGNSLMICGHVVPTFFMAKNAHYGLVLQHNPSDRVFSCIQKLDIRLNEWLQNRKIRAFYCPVANTEHRAGVRSLLQMSGLGKLMPNILLMGFKANWNRKGLDGLDDINDYFGIIRDAFDNNMSVGLMRNGGAGLDYSQLMTEHKYGDTKKLQMPEMARETSVTKRLCEVEDHPVPVASSFIEPYWNRDQENEELEVQEGQKSDNLEGLENKAYEEAEDDQEEETKDDLKEPKMEEKNEGGKSVKEIQTRGRKLTVGNIMRKRKMTMAQRQLAMSINRFQRKITNAVIDVWWLYDDGGLTLLIPHLLAVAKSYLEGAKMRVFTVASSRSTIEKEKMSMVSLLGKFRIQFTDVFVISDMTKPAEQTTKREFDLLIDEFCTNKANPLRGLITNEELKAQKNRTNRQLRCKELLLEHSSNAELIVITLLVPRRDEISSCLYMAWLDMLTRDLPPTLLIRGNQESVLTFYS